VDLLREGPLRFRALARLLLRRGRLRRETVGGRRLQAESPERAVRHLREAAGLYKGDYLEDLTIEGEWAMEGQDMLRRSYQEALLLLGGLLFSQKRHAEAADVYRRVIA